MRAAIADLDVEVVPISTTGDRDKASPFALIGPRGVFAAELQQALLDGTVDVAVHSLKDLPGAEPDGLELAAFPPRADAADVLVSRDGSGLDDLPSGAKVGTSSARRAALLRVVRPDVEAAPIRGNVDTRVAKVMDGRYDAAVLAAAGLDRLGRGADVAQRLDPVRFVPSPGQGAIVIERRAGELAWLSEVDDAATREAVTCERAFMVAVEGGCELPVGAWARRVDGALTLTGFVADADLGAPRTADATGDEPGEVAGRLAAELAR